MKMNFFSNLIHCYLFLFKSLTNDKNLLYSMFYCYLNCYICRVGVDEEIEGLSHNGTRNVSII